MKVEPYLLFNGRCEEALDFYTRALDAEVTALMRYSDAPDPDMRPDVPRDIPLATKNTPFRARGFSSRARRKNAGIAALRQVFTTQLSAKRRTP